MFSKQVRVQTREPNIDQINRYSFTSSFDIRWALLGQLNSLFMERFPSASLGTLVHGCIMHLSRTKDHDLAQQRFPTLVSLSFNIF